MFVEFRSSSSSSEPMDQNSMPHQSPLERLQLMPIDYSAYFVKYDSHDSSEYVDKSMDDVVASMPMCWKTMLNHSMDRIV